MPIIVFNMTKEGSLETLVVEGKAIGTVVSNK